MRYEIHIMFKEAHSSETLYAKSLKEVNDFLDTCIDDTVKCVDVRDTKIKTIRTFTGHKFSKAGFLHN